MQLDEATELDRGNPQELGLEHKKLKEAFNQLNIFGGCCGTDEEHVIAIAGQVKTAWLSDCAEHGCLQYGCGQNGAKRSFSKSFHILYLVK